MVNAPFTSLGSSRTSLLFGMKISQEFVLRMMDEMYYTNSLMLICRGTLI